MTKTLPALLTLAILFSATSPADVITRLPQTSDAQNANAAFTPGTAAWAPFSFGARLFAALDSGYTVPALDPYSPHLAPYDALSPGEFLILPSGAVYASNGCYWAVSDGIHDATGTVSVISLSRPIRNLTFSSRDGKVSDPSSSGNGYAATPSPRRRASDPLRRDISIRAAPAMSFDSSAASKASFVSVSNITAWAYPPRVTLVTNNLTSADCLLRDALGTFGLSSLRYSLLHANDDLLATNWAAYPASAPARLAGRTLFFDTNLSVRAEATFSDARTNIVTFIAGTRRAFSIISDSGGVYNSGFSCTIASIDLDPSTSSVLIHLYTDFTLDGSDYTILFSSSASPGSWSDIDAAFLGISSLLGYQTLLFRAPAPTQAGFFRVAFHSSTLDGAEPASAAVLFYCPPDFRDGFHIYDTNGVRWKVSVSTTGALTAKRE